MAITYHVALRLRPSKAAPGKFNWLNENGDLASVDPDGNLTWGQSEDGNYQQFTREGVMLIIQPGGDVHPESSTVYVLLPTGS